MCHRLQVWLHWEEENVARQNKARTYRHRDGFEQAELLDARKALENAGAHTVLIAPKSGKIQGMRHDEKGEAVEVDLALEQANPNDFDVALLPGGVVNADTRGST